MAGRRRGLFEWHRPEDDAISADTGRQVGVSLWEDAS